MNVSQPLSPRGILGQSGLVSVERSGASTLRCKLELLSENFADQILSTDADPVELLRDMVALAPPGHLEMTDFEHINPKLTILRAYLKAAFATGRRGVNLLLHGAPGTGKNQLSRAAGAELGCEVFEVTSADSDGDAVNGASRLRAFRAAQSFFGQRRALLVFDEVEDVFSDGGFFGHRSAAQTSKAWINRMLEDNPVPTVWLSNSIDCLDPAFIRRFDMVVELPVPPKRQRERIIREACPDLLGIDAIKRLAESEALAPAVITRAGSVVRSISADLGDAGAAAAVELLITCTLEAQGHPAIRKNDPNRLPEVYDPAFLHTDTDIAGMVEGIARTRSARMCLYGPPGTGKTAFGRWLAAQIGIPLHVQKASDLVSMWHGQTEQNIAHAFRHAEQEGALLLIDEVESFLQDRRGAQRSWEVSEVNEMLTQMESFGGVFIASTNLMGSLDQAALRRFDLKVKFDYLRTGQAWELLERQCAALGLPAPELGLRVQLQKLTMLTPGDFAAVARRHRFAPIGSPAALVAALAAECAVKAGGNQVTIGFV